MGLGSFKVRWWAKAQDLAGALLELAGMLPRERACPVCVNGIGERDNFCATCGVYLREDRAPL